MINILLPLFILQYYVICLEEDVAGLCSPGYWYNEEPSGCHLCNATILGCSECTDASTCTLASSGFSLVNNVPYKCSGTCNGMCADRECHCIPSDFGPLLNQLMALECIHAGCMTGCVHCNELSECVEAVEGHGLKDGISYVCGDSCEGSCSNGVCECSTGTYGPPRVGETTRRLESIFGQGLYCPSCFDIDDNCLECLDGDTCTKTCADALPGCIECTSADECTLVMQGYEMKDGIPYECHPSCQGLCDDFVCHCEEGTYINYENGLVDCLRCEVHIGLPGCAECTQTECLTTMQGFAFVTPDSGVPVPCDLTCGLDSCEDSDECLCNMDHTNIMGPFYDEMESLLYCKGCETLYPGCDNCTESTCFSTTTGYAFYHPYENPISCGSGCENNCDTDECICSNQLGLFGPYHVSGKVFCPECRDFISGCSVCSDGTTCLETDDEHAFFPGFDEPLRCINCDCEDSNICKGCEPFVSFGPFVNDQNEIECRRCDEISEWNFGCSECNESLCTKPKSGFLLDPQNGIPKECETDYFPCDGDCSLEGCTCDRGIAVFGPTWYEDSVGCQQCHISITGCAACTNAHHCTATSKGYALVDNMPMQCSYNCFGHCKDDFCQCLHEEYHPVPTLYSNGMWLVRCKKCADTYDGPFGLGGCAKCHNGSSCYSTLDGFAFYHNDNIPHVCLNSCDCSTDECRCDKYGYYGTPYTLGAIYQLACPSCRDIYQGGCEDCVDNHTCTATRPGYAFDPIVDVHIPKPCNQNFCECHSDECLCEKGMYVVPGSNPLICAECNIFGCYDCENESFCIESQAGYAIDTFDENRLKMCGSNCEGNCSHASGCSCMNGTVGPFWDTDTVDCLPCSNFSFGCSTCISNKCVSTLDGFAFFEGDVPLLCSPGCENNCNSTDTCVCSSGTFGPLHIHEWTAQNFDLDCPLCSQAMTGCKICTNENSCISPLSGYSLDNNILRKCVNCENECTNGEKCECGPNKFLATWFDSVECVECSDAMTGCETCSNSSVCTTTQDQYILHEGEIYFCDPTSTHKNFINGTCECNQNFVSISFGKYFPNEISCDPCHLLLPGCNTCSLLSEPPFVNCTSTIDGYGFFKDGNIPNACYYCENGCVDSDTCVCEADGFYGPIHHSAGSFMYCCGSGCAACTGRVEDGTGNCTKTSIGYAFYYGYYGGLPYPRKCLDSCANSCSSDECVCDYADGRFGPVGFGNQWDCPLCSKAIDGCFSCNADGENCLSTLNGWAFYNNQSSEIYRCSASCGSICEEGDECSCEKNIQYGPVLNEDDQLECIACSKIDGCLECSYDQDLKKAQCTVSQPGFALDINDDYTPKLCIDCDSNCDTDFSCECSQRDYGPIWSQTTVSCFFCSEGCVSCSSATFCNETEDYYAFFNNEKTAYPCDRRCVDFCVNMDTCTCPELTFGPIYDPVAGELTCKNCQEGCLSCVNEVTCLETQNGWAYDEFYVPQRCVSCVDNCVTDVCTCDIGEYGPIISDVGFECLSCASVFGCQECEDENTCLTTQNGFAFDDAGSIKECKDCENNCESDSCLCGESSYGPIDLEDEGTGKYWGCVLCEKAIQGCAQCDDDETCTQTLEGFAMNGKTPKECYQCDNNCENELCECNEGSFQKNGYFAFECVSCEEIKGCEFCTDDSTCTQSLSGYSLNSLGKPKKCVNCEDKCESGKCLCKEGNYGPVWLLEEVQCLPCSNVENCKNCKLDEGSVFQPICQECEQGYELSLKGECEKNLQIGDAITAGEIAGISVGVSIGTLALFFIVAVIAIVVIMVIIRKRRKLPRSSFLFGKYERQNSQIEMDNISIKEKALHHDDHGEIHMDQIAKVSKVVNKMGNSSLRLHLHDESRKIELNLKNHDENHFLKKLEDHHGEKEEPVKVHHGKHVTLFDDHVRVKGSDDHIHLDHVEKVSEVNHMGRTSLRLQLDHPEKGSHVVHIDVHDHDDLKSSFVENLHAHHEGSDDSSDEVHHHHDVHHKEGIVFKDDHLHIGEDRKIRVDEIEKVTEIVDDDHEHFGSLRVTLKGNKVVQIKPSSKDVGFHVAKGLSEKLS